MIGPGRETLFFEGKKDIKISNTENRRANVNFNDKKAIFVPLSTEKIVNLVRKFDIRISVIHRISRNKKSSPITSLERLS